MGKDGVLCCLGTAVNFGHPPARCARVPLRFAKGEGDGVLCISLGSRVRGNDMVVAGMTVVAALSCGSIG